MDSEPKKYSIKHWALDDRPREKLLQKGRNSLSNAELIAILIGSGNQKESAVDLAKRILQSIQNNLNQLSLLTVEELTQFKGIGQAKAISIITALELANRKNQESSKENKSINSSEDAFLHLKAQFANLLHEEFWSIYLNTNNQILAIEQLSKGGIGQTIVDVRLLLKRALQLTASNLILAHNHPSGNTKPSKSDLELTKRVKEAAKIMQIECLDHLIVTQNDYFSFADNQLM